MKKFAGIKETLKGGAIALTVGVLVATAAAAGTSIAHGFFNHQPKFTITNTISSSATLQTPALLYPGTSRYLWYTAHNPSHEPITVRTLSITSVNPPNGCPVLNLDYADTTFSGSLSVPAEGSNSVPVPISLIETHQNQDSCEHKAFEFTFSGTATFDVVAATQIQVSSTHNPSAVGQSVTYTATVVSAVGSANHHDAGTPTGSVTFFDGSTAICTGIVVTPSFHDAATATCASPTYLSSGVHPITAIFTNNDGNFSDSSSPVFHQIVQSARKTATIETSWPDPSVVGFPVTLSAEVFGSPSVPSGPTPSGTVAFYVGIPIGTHSELGTETLDATGKATISTSSLPAGPNDLFAVYNGDALYGASTSPVIVQVVLAKPGHCDGHYDNWFDPTASTPTIEASPGDNFFWEPSGSHHVNGGSGDDCFWGGDGNNAFSGGNGHDDITCGNGNNDISLGNGDDDVWAGNGTDQITLGGGDDTVSVGDGNGNQLRLGNGNDTIVVGGGTSDQIDLGSGNDTVTVRGNQASISGGTGTDVVYLGNGSGNTFVGVAHHQDVCHLPTPPSSWHGSPAAYFHDTLTNCTVVTS